MTRLTHIQSIALILGFGTTLGACTINGSNKGGTKDSAGSDSSGETDSEGATDGANGATDGAADDGSADSGGDGAAEGANTTPEDPLWNCVCTAQCDGEAIEVTEPVCSDAADISDAVDFSVDECTTELDPDCEELSCTCECEEDPDVACDTDSGADTGTADDTDTGDADPLWDCTCSADCDGDVVEVSEPICAGADVVDDAVSMSVDHCTVDMAGRCGEFACTCECQEDPDLACV